MAAPRPLLVTSDTSLTDDLLRLAAAAGVELHVAPDAEAAARMWRAAPLIVLDMPNALVLSRDLARRDGAQRDRRDGILVVSRDDDPEAWRVAVQVGAEHVACLPEAERWLIGRLAEGGEGPSRNGRVVMVTGAVGGAGASTLAVSLALLAAKQHRVLLVDVDPCGGGLDLLLGAENLGGARWPDLTQAHGRINAGALASALPCSNGVFLLSAAREHQPHIDADVLGAVLDAGVRGFDLVMIDVPARSALLPSVMPRSHDRLLVVPNHTRAVIAATHVIGTWPDDHFQILMRADGGGLADNVVAHALGQYVTASLPWQRTLANRADDGVIPIARDHFARACSAVLDAVGVSAARVA